MKEQAVCAPFVPSGEHVRTRVLVLGTLHLAGSRDVIQSQVGAFSFQAFESLLKVLERFAPDRIGVEVLPPSVVAQIVEREGPEAMGKMGRHGRSLQAHLNVSWKEAFEKSERLVQRLHPQSPPEDRIRAVAMGVAAYAWHTALLQWSYLPEDVRHHTPWIPANVRRDLEEDLRSRSEIRVIGIELARRLGHQRMEPVDGMAEDLPDPEQIPLLMKELEENEIFREFVTRMENEVRAQTERFHGWVQKGDVLPFYVELNRPAALRRTLEQWEVLFRTRLSSGLDRARVAMWEVRNLRMAANIRAVTARKPGGRVLVIVGASHKPFLDAYLQTQVDVEVVHFEDVVKGGG